MCWSFPAPENVTSFRDRFFTEIMDLVRSLEWVVIQYDQVLRERGHVDTGTRETAICK